MAVPKLSPTIGVVLRKDRCGKFPFVYSTKFYTNRIYKNSNLPNADERDRDGCQAKDTSNIAAPRVRTFSIHVLQGAKRTTMEYAAICDYKCNVPQSGRRRMKDERCLGTISFENSKGMVHYPDG